MTKRGSGSVTTNLKMLDPDQRHVFPWYSSDWKGGGGATLTDNQRNHCWVKNLIELLFMALITNIFSFQLYIIVCLSSLSDPHPFHADTDLGYKTFADADPDPLQKCVSNTDPDRKPCLKIMFLLKSLKHSVRAGFNCGAHHVVKLFLVHSLPMIQFNWFKLDMKKTIEEAAMFFCSQLAIGWKFSGFMTCMNWRISQRICDKNAAIRRSPQIHLWILFLPFLAR